MLPLCSDSPSTASLYASPFAVSIDSLLLLFALLNNTQLLAPLLGWCLNNEDAIKAGAMSALLRVHVRVADGGAVATAGSVRP